MKTRTSKSRPQVMIATYRTDPLYPRIVRAVTRILASSKVVAPVDVLVHMGMLHRQDLEAWRRGQVPYLERVIHGNLTRLGRLLRILRMHVHDLNLVPKEAVYIAVNSRKRLCFSKSGDRGVERAYAHHFIWPGKGPFHPLRRHPDRGPHAAEQG